MEPVRLPVHDQPAVVPGLREQRGRGAHPGGEERPGLEPVRVEAAGLHVVQVGAVQQRHLQAVGVVGPDVPDDFIGDREREPGEPVELQRLELDGGVLIRQGDDSIFLAGVALAELTARDFFFGSP